MSANGDAAPAAKRRRSDMSGGDKSYRVWLPDDVIPKRYDLELDTDMKKFIFTGSVAITVDVARATKSVTMHAAQLVVFSAEYKAQGSEKAVKPTTITYRTPGGTADSTLALVFDEELAVGAGVLSIKFQGVLNDQMAGYYRAKYKGPDGKDRYLATTQFEAIDARKCFPCWDEPSRKAVFAVTMKVPAGLTAVSNMPESLSVVAEDGSRKVQFLPTPIMSTYLLAFMLGEFDFVQGATANGTLVRCLAVPGKAAQLTYALREAIKTLENYNEYYGVPYPLPKLDMVAVPDFAAGAMENWGLVTYREADMLCDEATVSAKAKQRICTVITHELAHQWFGNLVTMAWWDDLWLNEGFANYMQHYGADLLHPEWKMWEQFITDNQMRALDLDAMRSSHPIQVPIAKAGDVEEVFDLISYNKGGSVVNMVRAVVGPEDFQKGLTAYFQKHQFSNTETADLWAAWEQASGKPIAAMMGSWTTQMGFPLLSVSGDPSSGEVTVTQSYFVADGSTQGGDAEKSWVVPIFTGSQDGQQLDMMNGKTMKIRVPKNGWFKLNYGQPVPCRVAYSPPALDALAAGMQSLPPGDRIGVLNDSYALAKNGTMCPSQLVRLMMGFIPSGGAALDLNDKVWAELGSCLSRLHIMIVATEDRTLIQGYETLAQKLLGPVIEQVGWDNRPEDDDNTKALRSTVISLASSFCASDESVRREAKRRYDAFLHDQKTPLCPMDIRGSVFSIIVQAFGDEAFTRLQQVHNATDDGHLQRNIYGALAHGGPELKKRLFAWALTEEVRSQDCIFPMASVARSTTFGGGAQIALDCVKEHYDRIYERLFGASVMLFMHVVKISGLGFVASSKADEIRAYWEAKKIDAIKRSIEQTVEGIQTNSKFLDKVIEAKNKNAFSVMPWLK